MFDRQKTYSVGEINGLIKTLLEEQFFYCSVQGEISNVARPQSGHLYFSLKDDRSVIRAVMWRSVANQFHHLVDNGVKVTLRGSITLYSPRGEYQLIVNHVEPFGVGDLHQRYEALKKRLELEGLFEARYKQEIKLNPQKIGIITSESAAALQDVLNVLQVHRPDIPYKLYPSLVQGAQAAESIVKAINQANRDDEVDLLLIVRGGGSIEDLWPFNEESVARAVFASSIPIISGIGHETDHTIIDFVADIRGATPSVAARLSSISREELTQYLDQQYWSLKQRIGEIVDRYSQNVERFTHQLQLLDPEKRLLQSKQQLIDWERRLIEGIDRRLNQYRERAERLESRLNRQYLMTEIAQRQHGLERLSERLYRAMESQLGDQHSKLNHYVSQLETLSPLNVLKRGYSLTYFKKSSGERQLVNQSIPLNRDDEIEIETSDRQITAIVSNVVKRNDQAN